LKRIYFAVLLGTFTVAPLMAATAVEQIGDAGGSRSAPIDASAPIWVMPEAGAVLYDNGPLTTCEGCGSGGADVSALQDQTLGMTVYGFGHQLSADNRVAEDFTVPQGGTWDISTITFFAYQPFAGNVSTITSVNLQIWDGLPDDPGSNVIFGDETTNRMSGTSWTGIYRTLEGDIGTGTDRAIMANVVDVNLTLSGGTYWLDWQTDGTETSSGPWAPPVTILGQNVTGNALQEQSGAPWIDIVDVTDPQGFPFLIEGSEMCLLAVDLDRDHVQPGDALDLSVRLDHLRQETVTVPFTISIQNEAGEIVVTRETGPRTYDYGDTLELERALQVPPGMAPGTYYLIVSTNEMTQGQIQARVPFEVVAP